MDQRVYKLHVRNVGKMRCRDKGKNYVNNLDNKQNQQDRIERERKTRFLVIVVRFISHVEDRFKALE